MDYKEEIQKLVEEIKAQGYEKICFFLPTYTVGGGAIIAYNIAKTLSDYKDLNVYYYDYKDGFIETTFWNNESNVKILHYEEDEINFPIKEKCIIFTNSTRAILLQKMNLQNKLVFWHYETTPIGWNLVFINNEKKKYLSLLKKENALCYHDWSAKDSLNRYDNANLTNKNYVQNVIDPKSKASNGNIINENEINIAFMSRLVPDKIQALYNLIDNYAKFKTSKKKRLHIIGAGRSARAAVEVQEDRVILLLAVDGDPLLRPIDIHIHTLTDAAFGRGGKDLPDNRPDQQQQHRDRQKGPGDIVKYYTKHQHSLLFGQGYLCFIIVHSELICKRRRFSKKQVADLPVR